MLAESRQQAKGYCRHGGGQMIPWSVRGATAERRAFSPTDKARRFFSFGWSQATARSNKTGASRAVQCLGRAAALAVGDRLTRLTEQAFTLPGDLAYQRHGLIFGARLAAAATRMEVTDAVFARNLRNFARQCVFHALLLGHISADDLRESTDIWRLVTASGSPSAGASPARMFEYSTRQAPSGTGATPVDREIVTCQDGAARLNGQWTAEIARAGTIFGRRLFPDADTDTLARAELLAALPAAHDFLIGASRSAGEIMRQQMVLNAVHDAGEQWASEAGNAAALRAYTEARAEAQTVSAYRAIGRQAETWVPLLRIVFECLYIGAFPMAVLLMLTPAGTAIFRSYVTGLIWLQSWGPLYAVLHRISMGEAAERMAASALMPGGDAGISLVAHPRRVRRPRQRHRPVVGREPRPGRGRGGFRGVQLRRQHHPRRGVADAQARAPGARPAVGNHAAAQSPRLSQAPRALAGGRDQAGIRETRQGRCSVRAAWGGAGNGGAAFLPAGRGRSGAGSCGADSGGRHGKRPGRPGRAERRCARD